MSDWSVLQTLKVIYNIISMSESKDGYIFCYFVSKSSKISHVGHLPLILKSPPNNTWKCTPVTFHTWDSNQYVGLHMHFSHPFLGIYEVVQFFDLGYPFQGWYMSTISIPWYHGMETSYHIHLFPIPCHLIPYHWNDRGIPHSSSTLQCPSHSCGNLRESAGIHRNGILENHLYKNKCIKHSISHL